MRKTISEKIKDFKDVVTANEIEQVASLIDRVDKEQLKSVSSEATKAAQATDPQKARQALERATAAMDQSVDNVQRASQRDREFASHQVLASISQDLNALHQYQAELKESTGKMLPEQYRRRQALVARQLRETAEMTREQSKTLRNGAEATGERLGELDGKPSEEDREYHRRG